MNLSWYLYSTPSTRTNEVYFGLMACLFCSFAAVYGLQRMIECVPKVDRELPRWAILRRSSSSHWHTRQRLFQRNSRQQLYCHDLLLKFSCNLVLNLIKDLINLNNLQETIQKLYIIMLFVFHLFSRLSRFGQWTQFISWPELMSRVCLINEHSSRTECTVLQWFQWTQFVSAHGHAH